MFFNMDHDERLDFDIESENVNRICVICPHKSYVKPEQIESAERITLKRPRGVETCNKYAKQRKMDITFKKVIPRKNDQGPCTYETVPCHVHGNCAEC